MRKERKDPSNIKQMLEIQKEKIDLAVNTKISFKNNQVNHYIRFQHPKPNILLLNSLMTL